MTLKRGRITNGGFIGLVCLFVFVVRQIGLPLGSTMFSQDDASFSGTAPKPPTRDGVSFSGTSSAAMSKKPPTFHIVISNSRPEQEEFSVLASRTVESVFFHHPDATLIIHANKDRGLPSGLQHPLLAPLLELGYDLRLHYYDPGEFLQGLLPSLELIDKPLALEFIRKIPTQYSKEKNWFANEANLMRILFMLQDGGIYLDTDVVLINPIFGSNPAIDDTIARRSKPYKRKKNGTGFFNAVMKFTRPGNPFLQLTLNEMFRNYNGNQWGKNGPEAWGRTAVQFPEMICDPITIHQEELHEHPDGCHIHPLPQDAVAAIDFTEWKKVCFSKKSPSYQESKKHLQNSLLVHFNNNWVGEKLKELLSKPSREIGEDSSTLCEYVLNKYCITCENAPR